LFSCFSLVLLVPLPFNRAHSSCYPVFISTPSLFNSSVRSLTLLGSDSFGWFNQSTLQVFTIYFKLKLSLIWHLINFDRRVLIPILLCSHWLPGWSPFISSDLLLCDITICLSLHSLELNHVDSIMSITDMHSLFKQSSTLNSLHSFRFIHLIELPLWILLHWKFRAYQVPNKTL